MLKTKDIESVIHDAYNIPYTKEAFDLISRQLEVLNSYVTSNHFLNSKSYLNEIEDIEEASQDLSSFKSSTDRLRQRKIQKRIAVLARRIIEENRKIFIVHGRNIIMRDRLSSLLGFLKLDYVILENEYNSGSTIIEKFIRSAEDCGYAIVLFSGDDLGKLDSKGETLKKRPRQNVILELGYFLAKVGRKNIAILHEVNSSLEKPSDFQGIVYEPFDDYGGWKMKIIKEMRKAGIYVDSKLVDRV